MSLRFHGSFSRKPLSEIDDLIERINSFGTAGPAPGRKYFGL